MFEKRGPFMIPPIYIGKVLPRTALQLFLQTAIRIGIITLVNACRAVKGGTLGMEVGGFSF